MLTEVLSGVLPTASSLGVLPTPSLPSGVGGVDGFSLVKQSHPYLLEQSAWEDTFAQTCSIQTSSTDVLVVSQDSVLSLPAVLIPGEILRKLSQCIHSQCHYL